MDSTRLLTGSADSSAKLWDVETGENLFTFKHKAPCKAVAFGMGDALAAISTDPFMTTTPAIHLVRIAADAVEQSADALHVSACLAHQQALYSWRCTGHKCLCKPLNFCKMMSPSLQRDRLLA